MKKILIIEDDYDIGEIVEMVLSSQYQTLVKRDSRQLCELLVDYMPDLILIDNHIGQKDAREIISEIRARGTDLKNIPLVLFSGDQDIQKIAHEIGAVGFLPKPFDLFELHQTVSRGLSKSGKSDYSITKQGNHAASAY